MKTSKKGIDLIKKYEGCELKAYKCPAGIVTIGYGNTFYENKAPIKMGDQITKERAEQLLLNLLPKYEATVNRNIRRPLTQNEYDSLISFCWNCGSSETLFNLVNSRDPNTVEWWKTHYIKGGGVILNGLVKRRSEEANLYNS